MAKVVIVGVDGSEMSTYAATRGVSLLQPGIHIVVVNAVEPADPSLVTGAGFAGGVVSPDELQQMEDEKTTEAREHTAAAAAALGIEGAEQLVVQGDAGNALCNLATERGAEAIVLGTHGRGGIKRAFLGSVSDYVVRNAPCTVIVTRHDA